MPCVKAAETIAILCGFLIFAHIHRFSLYASLALARNFFSVPFIRDTYLLFPLGVEKVDTDQLELVFLCKVEEAKLGSILEVERRESVLLADLAVE